MITDEHKEDALQVAAVRLRLEGVPFKIVHRRDYPHEAGSANWTLPVDSCVVYCRTTMQPGDRGPLIVVVEEQVECGYILEDGIERPAGDGSHHLLMQLALQLRGIGSWFSSGGGL